MINFYDVSWRTIYSTQLSSTQDQLFRLYDFTTWSFEFSNPTVNIIVNKMVTFCVSIQQSMRIWETVEIFSRIESFEFHISGPLTTAAVASLSSIFSTYATMTKH